MKRTVVLYAVATLWEHTASADELTAVRGQALVEVSHAVDIRIADGVATYRVRRQFANPGTLADEAGLAIDLPSGAVATGLRIRAKDRWYDGELMEREKAAARYHELTGLGAYAPKDPALLQWRWADKLYLQVFPVMPGGVSTVEYTLTVPTQYTAGRYWLSYPRTDTAAAKGLPLATPTVTVKPAWGDATTAITIDGHRIAPDTAVVLVVPPHQPWEASLSVESNASYVASTLVVPESSHTKKPITTAKLDFGITHTFQGDLRVELVTPKGKAVEIHNETGGTTNNLGGVRDVVLPPDTIGTGTWHLVVSDHARLDVGSLDRWKLSFGSGADATTIAAADTPVFIPDAPENAGEAGVATIGVAPPPIAQWTARLGRAIASPANAFARLEVDVAPQLSKLPVRAQVVFVVDASFSVGDTTLAAQLATLRAYLTHVPDADVEIVAYRRRATRIFGAFVPAKQLDERLRAAVAAKAFALGNGSALDEGAAVAVAALANRSGPRRIVVLTDELLRTSLPPKRALAAFAALAPDTVLHVIVPHDDHDDRPKLDRDDLNPLALLATRHHGIFAHLRGFPLKADKDLPPLVLELVRPTRIERLAVPGFTVESTTLAEGDGLRLWTKGKAVPDRVVATGYLWSDPIRREAATSTVFSRATAGFVFGADEHTDLSQAEMMTLALAGRAVTPVTSYIAAEPGTRPSTLGLDDGSAFGGLLGNEAGEMNGGFGFGRSARMQPNLAAMLDTSACVKAHKPAAGWNVTLDVETTKDEIVDVTFAGKGSPFASCLVEAMWAVRLDAQFDLEREDFSVNLGSP